MDFNAAVDRLRVVNSADANLRINPNTGVRVDTPTNDALLNPAGRLVDGVAYDRNLDGSSGTSAYAIARDTNALVRLGGAGGTPSANAGALTPIGALGLTINAAGGLGFDIDDAGVARAALSSGGTTALYTLHLGAGVALQIGPLGTGSSAVDGFAMLPERIFADGFE